MSALLQPEAIEKTDLLMTRARQSSAILSLLSTAIQDDSPPTQDAILDTLSAVQELLSV